MTHNLTRKLWLCVGLWLTLAASGAVSAQDAKNTYAPSIAAAATTEQARFLADNEVTNIRLEVFTLADARLYDSDFKAGNLLDWRWQDQQGQALTDGAYRCVVTVKDLTGHSSQRHGVLLVQNGVASWQAPEQAEAALRNTAAARATEGIAYFATVTNPSELTAAVLAHNGKEARLLTGNGGLSVRTGNFLKGEEQEKLRLTEEGKLEIKGLISTGEGIAFPDGTVQKTAYVASGQTLKQIAEDGKKLSPNAPAVGGSGTPNVLLKWQANGVDATNSTVTDLGPGGGISVNGSIASSHFISSASGTFWALWPAISGSATLLRSNSFSGNLWIGHLGNVGLGTSDPGSRFATGGNATIGGSYYNTAAPTNGLLVEGNVGIGMINPTTRLDVTSNIGSQPAIRAFSTAYDGVQGSSGTSGAYGVWGYSTSSSGTGVNGRANAVSGGAYGVHGSSSSPAGAGVRAEGSGNAGTALQIENGGIKVPGAGIGTFTPVFIHQAIAANITGNVTRISHPLTDGNPNAILIVTPNWNPGGVGGVYNNHSIGVFYDVGNAKWAIFNQNTADAMPVNAAFNILVIKTSAAGTLAASLTEEEKKAEAEALKRRAETLPKQ